MRKPDRAYQRAAYMACRRGEARLLAKKRKVTENAIRAAAKRYVARTRAL